MSEVTHPISRRALLAISSAVPLAFAAKAKHIPIGLELYSVRDELAKDPAATVRAVAKMGYEVVEFYAPYFDWTPEQAKQMRQLMDGLGIRCNSTHNNAAVWKSDEGLQKAMELNHILGAKYIVMSSAGKVTDLEGWKAVAARLTHASERFKSSGLRAGYHNHKLEFVPIAGKRPMEVLAAETPADVMLQFDVGTCVEAGSDPVAWIEGNPGRIRSLHLKDWAPGDESEKGFRVLFGEGTVPWSKVFAAAEKTGGVEYYLIEQEGSRYSSYETAERCLATWKQMSKRG